MSNLIQENIGHLMPENQFKTASDSEEAKVSDHLLLFESLKSYPMVVMAETVSLISQQQKSFLCLLSLTFTSRGVKSPHSEQSFSEYEIIGIAPLRKDYGQVLIRPESLEDKISEVFIHTDIDFDIDHDFSRKFYVDASDEDRLRLRISPGFLRTFSRFHGIEAEISGNVLMARLRKPFTVENGIFIAGFLAEINNGEN